MPHQPSSRAVPAWCQAVPCRAGLVISRADAVPCRARPVKRQLGAKLSQFESARCLEVPARCQAVRRRADSVLSRAKARYHGARPRRAAMLKINFCSE